MAKYMLSICYGERQRAEHPSDDAFIMDHYRKWSEAMGQRICSAHKLVDGTGRKVIKGANGVVEGPYAETKESIGGYYIVDVETIEEAVELARGCPTVLYQGGYVDVREVEF